MAPRGSGRSKVRRLRARDVAVHRRRAQASGAEQIRRGGGLRRLPDLLRRVLEPAARRRGLAEAKLLTEWPTVVGPMLATRCHPIRLSARPDGPGGVLVLHVAGAAALELQHSEPQILERINGYFGYGAVGRLRLIQAPLPRSKGRAPPPPSCGAVRCRGDRDRPGRARDQRPGSAGGALRARADLESAPGAIEPGAAP